MADAKANPIIMNHTSQSYQVYSSNFRIIGVVSLLPKYFDQAAAEALAMAKKQFPQEIGLMVSPLREYHSTPEERANSAYAEVDHWLHK